MPTSRIPITLLLFALLTITCRKPENLVIDGKTQNDKLCYVKYAGHGHNIAYNFSYDSANLLTGLEGFPDFNKITYVNGQPVKAENTRDKSYYITFTYDAKGGLSGMNFTGKDSADRPFEYKSTAVTNSARQVEKINLALPVFDGILEAIIEYDTNGNVKKISITKDGKLKPVLENLSFDNNKSPYAGASLTNIMLYFVVFSAAVGAENTTYFINKNNVISSKIYAANGDVALSYEYDYNAEKYPARTRISRMTNGKEENYQESFSYSCPE